MNRLLPFQSSSRPTPAEESRIVGIDEHAAGEVFEALSSETTRDVLTAVYDTPGTATEIAKAVDTSLQNVKYHLTKLQEADLIEVADTWYSEQGNEMKVYAPTNESVVVLAGDETTRSSLRETLSRLIGTVGVLGIGSILIDTFGMASSPYQWDSRPRPGLPSWLPFVEPISPGNVFFLGGVVALAVIAVWSFVRES